MKVNFGNYIFFDNVADNKTISATNNSSAKQYAFDETKFNNLIANRQYNDAADYAAQFHFSDPKIQKEHENDIINLRREGRVLGAIYGKIHNDIDLKKVEFYDKVFVDGGLEQLNTSNKNASDYNEYAEQFIDYKRKLGSTIENGEIKDEATRLSITFEPEKQYGLFGIDWLAKDNKNNIDNFYAQSGLNEQQLKAAGVKIIHKDNKTTLDFDKSNKFANQIIFNLPKDSRRMGDTPFRTSGKNVSIVGYTSKGESIIDKRNESIANLFTLDYNRNFENIQNLINSAKTAKESYFKKNDLDTKQYSSTVGPMISDELSSLREELNNGQITDTQYNNQARAIAPHVFSAIYTLGSSNYEMYTNNFNDEDTDETLVSVENKDRAELTKLINNYDPKDIDVSAMISNGKIGALITLKGTGNETQSDKNDGRRIQIFVPGLLQEEAQAKINRNTSTRAAQEINSMIDWGYSYKLRNGSEISTDGVGNFMKGKEIIDKQTAIQEINKDMIVQDALHNLKFQYMNTKGDIINNTKYEQMAKLLAMNAVSDVYGDINLNVDNNTKTVTLSDKFGNVYNQDDIFDRNIKEDETQYEVYDRLNDIYAIYNELMNELAFYK